MPSSFVTRKRIAERSSSVGEARRIQQRHQLLEIALQRFQGLDRERAARKCLEVSAFAVFVDLLPRAFDREFLYVQQMLHEHDQLDLAPLIDTITRPVLGRIEKTELAFPIPQDVRLQVGELAHLADRKELLHWLRGRRWGHRSCSGRSSRDIRSAIAERAECPSKSIR